MKYVTYNGGIPFSQISASFLQDVLFNNNQQRTRNINIMKKILILLVLIISLPLHAQDITNKLGGNTANETYDVTDSNDNLLFRVQGDGNVGIGIINPTYSLTVQKDLGIITGEHFFASFFLPGGDAQTSIGYRADGTNVTRSIVRAGNNRPLDLGTTGSRQALSILDNGNVGIGIINPDEKLHIAGNMRLNGALEDKDGEAGTAGQILSSTVTGTDWIAAPTSNSGWSLTGNAGTTASKNFVGTTDDIALEFKVNGNRAMRYEPDALSPNIIGGYNGNSVTGGVYGAFIGGGGYTSYENTVTANYGSVIGGRKNTASGAYSTAMGRESTASGETSIAMGVATTATKKASVAMGNETIASAIAATAIGSQTLASATTSTAMGYKTTASGAISTAMGYQTTASGEYSTVMGNFTVAESFSCLAIGQYNVGGGHATLWTLTDPLFEVGIGTNSSDKKNAMTVLKNGKIGIGTTTPDATLDVNGTVKMFGKWDDTSYKPEATYYTKTDGFVLASFMSVAGGKITISGRTDTNLTPKTTRVLESSIGILGEIAWVSITMPVKQANYWMVASEGTKIDKFVINWIPLGQ